SGVERWVDVDQVEALVRKVREEVGAVTVDDEVGVGAEVDRRPKVDLAYGIHREGRGPIHVVASRGGCNAGDPASDRSTRAIRHTTPLMTAVRPTQPSPTCPTPDSWSCAGAVVLEPVRPARGIATFIVLGSKLSTIPAS